MKYMVTRDCWHKNTLYRKGPSDDPALEDCAWAEKVKKPAATKTTAKKADMNSKE